MIWQRQRILQQQDPGYAFAKDYERQRLRQEAGDNLIELLAAAPGKPFTVMYDESIEAGSRSWQMADGSYRASPMVAVLMAQFEVRPVAVMDVRMAYRPPIDLSFNDMRHATPGQMATTLIGRARQWLDRQHRQLVSRSQPLVEWAAPIIEEWNKRGRP